MKLVANEFFWIGAVAAAVSPHLDGLLALSIDTKRGPYIHPQMLLGNNRRI
jgi:hypothetical protein